MHVGLLGPVEVRRGGLPLPLSGVRLRGLLARLALDVDRPVPRAVLVDDLWAGAAPAGVGNALQALVSRLRRVVGADAVVTEAGGYRLRLPAGHVDATRFDELVAAAGNGAAPVAAREHLDEALALWRGPALSDLAELPFTAAAAARLLERRARAVEHRARIALRLTDPEPELDALAAQLAELPLREETAALLARCLHAAGRQADALAVLDTTIARLADELGVDPGAAVRAARMAVLQAGSSAVDRVGDAAGRGRPPAPEPVAPVPAAHTPPSPARAAALTGFVGREADLARIRSLLGGTRLITLTGPGGAGKTRLATEAVAAGPPASRTSGAAAGEPPGPRVVVAELAPLTTADQLPAALLAAVGGAALMRVQEDPAPDTTARLLSALSAGDTVLVLDNCEHLVDAVAPLVATVLDGCPRLRVVATSREPLGVPGEVLHPVEALAPDDAARLFAERAAAVRPGFRRTPETAGPIAEICRRLDGQPLPIELAAARLRTLSPAEIAARLDDRFRLLTSGARTALPRHQTLRAVVDWSWDLLAEPERVVARRLASFAGGATVGGVEAVCAGAPGPAAADVFEVLASLVDKSVVVAVPAADGPTRYRMLETIREYAAAKLDTSGERAAAEGAHTRFVLDLVERTEPHLRTADQLPWLAGLAAEAEEIDLALSRATTARDADTAHRLVAGMAWSWLIRGLNEEGQRWVLAARELDGPVAPAAGALTAVFHVLMAIGREHPVELPPLIERAIRLAARVPPPRHPVLDLLEPVDQIFTDGDETLLRQLADRTGDPWTRAAALAALGAHAGNVGRIDEERALVREAHTRFARIGDRFGLGMVVHSLGELEDVAGHHEAAARAYDEAIDLAAELANDDDLPQFVARRAMLDARRGDLVAAAAGLDRAGDLVVGDGRASWHVLGAARADLARLGGDLTRARAELDRAAAQFPAGGPGAPQRRASLAVISAAIELAAGDLAAARAVLTDAVRWAAEGRDGPVSAVVAEAVAGFAHAAGDPEDAAELLGVAAAQRGAPDLGNPEVVALDAALRDRLGPEVAEAAFRRGRDLPRDEGLDRLAAVVGAEGGPVAAAGAVTRPVAG